ncbi:MAG: carboxypeptidase-like regulatory domain-containing protein [Planctomycetota bacterium]
MNVLVALACFASFEASVAASGNTSINGFIRGPDGQPVRGAQVTLLNPSGRVLARGDVEERSGRYAADYRTSSSGGLEVVTAVRIEADGYVTAVVSPHDGEVVESENDRGVNLDVELARARVVELRVLGPDLSPVGDARVDLRRPVDPTPLWEPPPLGTATTDAAGWARFEGMPTSGLVTATVHLPSIDEWTRTTVDLSAQMTRVMAPRPCSLQVEIAEEVLAQQASEDGPWVLVAISESRPPGSSVEIGPDGMARLDALPEGSVVALQLFAASGRARWLDRRVALGRGVTRVRIDEVDSPVRRIRVPRVDSRSQPQVHWRLVGSDGAPLGLGDVGTFAPGGIIAEWRQGDATGVTAGRFTNQWDLGFDLTGALESPVRPPYEATPRWQGRELATVAVDAVGDVLDVTVVPEEVRRVTFRAEGDPRAFGAEIRRLGRWEHLFAGWSSGPDRVTAHLPLGRYVYAVDSRAIGSAAGSFEVTESGPDVVELEFPGLGAANGRIRSDAPVVSLTLVRQDGPLLPGVGAHVAALGPGGRFSATGVLAGDYDVVAKVLRGDGAVIARVAEGVRIGPGEIVRLDDLVWRAQPIVGPRVRRRSGTDAVSAIVSTADRCVFAGDLAPGDVVLLPSTDEVRVQLGPEGSRQPEGREIIAPIRGDDAVVDV